MMILALLSCACYAQELTSNLPIVIINTISEPINDEPGVVVNFKIINNAAGPNRCAQHGRQSDAIYIGSVFLDGTV